MKKTLARGVAAGALAGLAVVGAAAPALAAPGPAPSESDVVIVDEPDTSDLHNVYTVAPLGVPVLGLIRSINAVPGKLLPTF